MKLQLDPEEKAAIQQTLATYAVDQNHSREQRILLELLQQSKGGGALWDFSPYQENFAYASSFLELLLKTPNLATVLGQLRPTVLSPKQSDRLYNYAQKTSNKKLQQHFLDIIFKQLTLSKKLLTHFIKTDQFYKLAFLNLYIDIKSNPHIYRLSPTEVERIIQKVFNPASSNPTIRNWFYHSFILSDYLRREYPSCQTYLLAFQKAKTPSEKKVVIWRSSGYVKILDPNYQHQPQVIRRQLIDQAYPLRARDLLKMYAQENNSKLKSVIINRLNEDYHFFQHKTVQKFLKQKHLNFTNLSKLDSQLQESIVEGLSKQYRLSAISV